MNTLHIALIGVILLIILGFLIIFIFKERTLDCVLKYFAPVILILYISTMVYLLINALNKTILK